VRDGQDMKLISSGRRDPAQALACPDHGLGEAGRPVPQTLIQGGLPERAGILVILDGSQKGLFPLISDHAKIKLRAATPP